MSRPALPPRPLASPGDAASNSEQGQINQNLDAVMDFYTREDQKIGRSQRVLERISLVIGKPIYLGSILLFVLAWVITNVLLPHGNRREQNPPGNGWWADGRYPKRDSTGWMGFFVSSPRRYPHKHWEAGGPRSVGSPNAP